MTDAQLLMTALLVGIFAAWVAITVHEFIYDYRRKKSAKTSDDAWWADLYDTNGNMK